MSNVLFLGMPSHGHINPTLGLVNELVKNGEQVIYFASPEFRTKIEAAGARFRSYNEDLNLFKIPGGQGQSQGGQGLSYSLFNIIKKAPGIIADILEQTKGIKFDYLIHSAAFPFALPLTQILSIPAVSSLAVFAGLRKFSEGKFKNLSGTEAILEDYKTIAGEVKQLYDVEMPADMKQLLINKAGLNIVYTSRYFVPDPDFFDNTYIFVGPPVFERQEDTDFPFEKIKGKPVLYISLGTVFGNFSMSLYDRFIKEFAGWNGIVVMAAHKTDLSSLNIPDNFIVRDYVPQNALLKHATAAITHAGMNSISDLISNHVPFVCLPLGADQPLLSRRAEELGATIVLDAANLDAGQLKNAVEKVTTDPHYLKNIRKIDESFREAGGYPRAVQEVFRFVKHSTIKNGTVPGQK